MSQELLYTSAPKGLKQGARGFCMVMCSEGMPAPLATALEGLSGYKAMFPPGHPQESQNPVARSHVVLPAVGRKIHVLSRVAAYGLDYSGRPNKLAHHLALDPRDQTSAGPAWLIKQHGVVRSEWSGEPRQTATDRKLPTGNTEGAICQEWQAATGDAGWGGVVAEAILADPSRLIFLIHEPGFDPFPLIAETIALLPPERRWDATFSTYFNSVPPGVICNWRCLTSDSPLVHQSKRHVHALRIDLTQPMGKAAGRGLVELSRSGIPNQVVADLSGIYPVGADGEQGGETHLVSRISVPHQITPHQRTRKEQPPRLRPASPNRRSALSIAVAIIFFIGVATAVWQIGKTNRKDSYHKGATSTPVVQAKKTEVDTPRSSAIAATGVKLAPSTSTTQDSLPSPTAPSEGAQDESNQGGESPAQSSTEPAASRSVTKTDSPTVPVDPPTDELQDAASEVVEDDEPEIVTIDDGEPGMSQTLARFKVGDRQNVRLALFLPRSIAKLASIDDVDNDGTRRKDAASVTITTSNEIGIGYVQVRHSADNESDAELTFVPRHVDAATLMHGAIVEITAADKPIFSAMLMEGTIANAIKANSQSVPRRATFIRGLNAAVEWDVPLPQKSQPPYEIPELIVDRVVVSISGREILFEAHDVAVASGEAAVKESLKLGQAGIELQSDDFAKCLKAHYVPPEADLPRLTVVHFGNKLRLEFRGRGKAARGFESAYAVDVANAFKTLQLAKKPNLDDFDTDGFEKWLESVASSVTSMSAKLRSQTSPDEVGADKLDAALERLRTIRQDALALSEFEKAVSDSEIASAEIHYLIENPQTKETRKVRVVHF